MLNILNKILNNLRKKEPESELDEYRLDKKSNLYLPNSFFRKLGQPSLEKKPDLKGLSHHPLAAIVVGFFLTTVAGTLLSNYYNQQQIERNRFFEVTATRRAALQDFARLLYRRRTRAAMLASSLLRSAPLDEVKERKRFYDDAFVDWDSGLQANLFLIRSVLQSEGYSDFEGHVEFRLTPILSNIDRCLTRAYDQRLQNESSKVILKTLNSCQIRKILQYSLDCSYAITDQLYQIAVPIKPFSAEEIERGLNEANTVVIKSCANQGS